MMPGFLACTVVGPPLLLLGAAAVPGRIIHRHPLLARQVVTCLIAVALLASALASALLISGGPLDSVRLAWGPRDCGVWFDSLAAVMSLMTAGVGLVVARFAARLLDGEPNQGRFFRWLGFTIGAVLVMVVSRSLLMLLAGWMLVSLGLHMLLVHYDDRPWAIWAARKKFVISRLGDLLLLGAVGLCLVSFGSTDFDVLFEEAAAAAPGTPAAGRVALISLCLVLGAMTKSAQVPFHSWLPDTMEAPTPVSALMHAGIINAGGYLVIRLSPFLVRSPFALDCLVAVGGVTALCGGVVMMSQTSVKRALAFSTIAQMGFMMLQCGLGAFAAAMLHIVAHSSYKAHAFLSSGGVIDAASRSKPAARAPGGRAGAVGAVLSGVLLAFGICMAVFSAWGVDPAAKPGGLLLSIVLVLAIATLLRHGLSTGGAAVAGVSVLLAVAVALAHEAAMSAASWVLEGSPIGASLPAVSPLRGVVVGCVALGFFGVFLLQVAEPSLARLPAVRALHVHAANGFYLDIPVRRLTARLWGLSQPVP